MAVPNSLRVFVSATTADLGACREAVAAVLRKAQIFPVIQEELPASSSSLHEVLSETIASCDAVVCLVGKVFGAKPADQTASLRSYTQLEYLAAREMGKPTFVFLTHDSFTPEHPVEEAEDWRSAQDDYRAGLMATHKCEWFHNLSDLRLQAAQLVPRLLDVVVQPIYYLHPPERPAFFVGRRFEYEQLDAALRQLSPSILAVAGMGGQGKTTLVAEFLRTCQGLRHSAGFWCTAYRASFTFDMFLDEALRYLSRGSFVKQNSLDTSARIRCLLEFLQARRVLLVIDGLERWLLGWTQDEPKDTHSALTDPRAGGHDGLDEFLRQVSGLSNGTHLILTTRAIPSVLDRLSVALVPIYPEDQEARLHGIDVGAAVELLRRQRVNGTDSQLAAIATQWDCHPLTLGVLSGLLSKRYGGDVSRMPSLNALDPRLPLNSLLDETRKHLPAAELTERIMKAVSLAEENPSTALIAAGVEALLPGQSISEDVVVDGAVALSEWQLMDWKGEHGYAVVHPLIQKYFETLLAPGERTAVHAAFAEWYSREALPNPPSALSDVRPRILAIIHYCHAGNPVAASSLLLGEFEHGISFLDWLAGYGHHVTAIDLLSRLLSPADAREKGRLLAVRGALRTELGDFAAALADLDESVRGLTDASKAGEPEAVLDLVGALINRGNAKGKQSDKTALADFDSALAELSGIGGIRWMFTIDWLVAQVRLNRSSHLADRGRLSEAVSDITVSIDKCRSFARENPDGADPVLAMAISNRALLYLAYGRYQDAIGDLDEACSLYAALTSSGRADLRATYAHIRATRAVAYDEAQCGAEVLAHFDDAVADLQELAEAGREDVELNLALALMNRGFSHFTRNNLSLAVEDGERALSSFRHRARADRRAAGYAGHTLLNLAAAYFRLGRTAESLKMLNEGLAVLHELSLAGVSCQAVFFRKAVRAAAYWAEVDPALAVDLLTRAEDAMSRAIAEADGSEDLAIEVTRVWKQVGPTCARLDTCAAGPEILGRLRNLVDRCGGIREAVEVRGRPERCAN